MKVGEYVIIKLPLEDLFKMYPNYMRSLDAYTSKTDVYLNPSMIKYNGKKAKIVSEVECLTNDQYKLDIDTFWVWPKEWLVLQKRSDKLKRILC